MDVLPPRQTAGTFQLVGGEVSEDYVSLLVGVVGAEVVHEVQELPSPSLRGVARLDLAGNHVEGGEERPRACR